MNQKSPFIATAFIGLSSAARLRGAKSAGLPVLIGDAVYRGLGRRRDDPRAF